MLTTEELDRFIGGGVEIHDTNGSYIYRGQIKSIRVDSGILFIEFQYLIIGYGLPTMRTWFNVEKLDYSASLHIYIIKKIDCKSHPNGKNRLCLYLFSTGETIIFSPPNNTELNKFRFLGFNI